MNPTSARAAVEESLRAIRDDARRGVWIDLVDEEVVAARAAEVDRRVAAGETLPLAGTTMAVKGNIDVEGLDTTAACPAFAHRPLRSATVVRALTDAGAVVMGTTNLDQFATGLVGTRSPYGICPNAHWEGLVSGGSSSGSAVAVAAGMVDFALGTDTAGSGRVPAAANGIVGLKPTLGRLSTDGVVPACASFDCVSVFAREVALAALVADVASSGGFGGAAAAPTPGGNGHRRVGSVRVGTVRGSALGFDGDPGGPAAHDLATDRLLEAFMADPGIEADRRDLDPAALDDLIATGRLLYGGAFVAERYAAVGEFVDAHLRDVDPVVGPIISAAGRIPAWQLVRDRARLDDHRSRAAALFGRTDVLVVPTVPRVPTVAEVLADPVGVNSMLGTYTNFVNLLDLCALTVPIPGVHDDPARPPHSLTLVGPAGADGLLVRLATSLEGRSATLRSR